MHTHFFIFIFIFLGAARSLAQASDPAGKNQRNYACMNSANVIKLSLHSVLATMNSKNAKRDEEWAYLPGDGEDACSAVVPLFCV
jgi:hypothetical protein